MNSLNETRYCAFHLGELYLAIPVDEVREVIRYQNRTRVPLVPGVIHGLINLRGEIVTTIDLRERLNIGARDSDELPINVVVRHDGGVVSLLVDEISDVRQVRDKDFEFLPPTMHEEYRRFIKGIYKTDGQLLLVLDTDKLLELGDLIGSDTDALVA